VSDSARDLGRAGFFGKLPSKRDFVRVRHDLAAAIALDEWLAGAAADYAEKGGRFTPPTARFWYAHPDRSLAGVITPSRDRAGRAFPATVYAAIETGALARDPAAVCAGSESFMETALTLLRAHTSEERAAFETLQPALDALPPPRPKSAPDVYNLLDAEPWDTLLERLALPKNAALARLRDFVQPHRGRPPHPAAVLEVPAPDITAVLFWLRLLSASLRWPANAAMSLFWFEPDRLLCALGDPPAALLNWADDGSTGARQLTRLADAPTPSPATVQEVEALLAAVGPGSSAVTLCARWASLR